MDMIPASARAAMHAVLEDALSDLMKTTEPFGIEMDHRASTLVLVPIRGGSR